MGSSHAPSPSPTLALSELDLNMPAGRLAVVDSVNLTLPLHGPTQALQVALDNVGGMGVNFNLVTIEGAQYLPPPALAYASRKRKFPSKLLNDATAINVYTHAAPVAPALSGGDLLGYWDGGLADAWGIAYDMDTDSLWLNSRADERARRFQPDGTSGGTLAADLSGWVTAFAADMAYDPVSRQVWALNVGGDNCLHAFDAVPGPNQGADHGDRICPDFTVTQRGLAYNPLRDTFFSGSWTNEIVYEFDRQGQVVSAANLGLAISGLAYNPATDHLFVLTNADTGFDVYVVDVSGDGPGGYEILGGFDILGLGGWDQAGLALGCDGSLWAVDQVTGTVLRAASGETDVCAWTASEWLIVTPTAGAVSAGGQKILTFTFNPQTLRPGVAVGAVRMGTDTPYGVFSIPVTLTIANTYGVSLAETTQDRSGLPGQVVTYTVTVQNSGTVTDSYSLSLSGHNWSSQGPTSVGPIPLRGSETVVVSVTIPAQAAPGDRDTVTVNLTSQTDPTAQINGSLTTTVGDFAVSLAPDSSSLSANPGTTITHTVTITNQGTVTDSFTLSKVGTTWLTSVPATVGPLAPGASVLISVSVHIPAGTAAGAANNATLTATSMADRRRSASIVLKTTAKAVYQVSMTPNGATGKDRHSRHPGGLQPGDHQSEQSGHQLFSGLDRKSLGHGCPGPGRSPGGLCGQRHGQSAGERPHHRPGQRHGPDDPDRHGFDGQHRQGPNHDLHNGRGTAGRDVGRSGLYGPRSAGPTGHPDLDNHQHGQRQRCLHRHPQRAGSGYMAGPGHRPTASPGTGEQCHSPRAGDHPLGCAGQ